MGLCRRTALGYAMGLLAAFAARATAAEARMFFGEAELAALMQRQFPRRQRVADAIDVRFESPRLRLVPQRNRLATALDVTATELVFGGTAKGIVDLEYGLRYEPGDATVRLRDVRVSSLTFDRTQGGPNPASFVSRSLAEKLLDDLAFAKLAPQRVEALRAMGLERATLLVTDLGLDVIFSAAPAR
jgi:hypothetical protein